MNRRSRAAAAVILIISLIPAIARGRTGTVALVNLGHTGAEVVLRAGEVLGKLVGGWSSQPGVRAFLAGRSSPGSLPAGEPGKQLIRKVERLRSQGRVDRQAVTSLGQLLGVDYLLLVKIRTSHLEARLYSVHRQSYSKNPFTGPRDRPELLEGYLKKETRRSAPVKKRGTPWWIWVVAAGLGAVTIGVSLAATSGQSGDLRVRVSR